MKIREKFKEALVELQNEMLNDSEWIKDWNIYFKNFESNYQYNGINVLLIARNMLDRNHKQPYFMTFQQAKKASYKIKKGAKSYPIFFFNIKEKEIKNEEEIETIKIPILRQYFLFNIEDIEGIEIENEDSIAVKGEAELIIKKAKEYIPILYGNPAYYPKKHQITMPNISNFDNVDSYLAALFHELIHSTTIYFNREKFSYAEEEIIAELGAVFLCKHFKIDYPMSRHSAYIKSWANEVENKSFYFIIKNAFQATEKLLDILS